MKRDDIQMGIANISHVSVVIKTFNEERRIRSCIESVLTALHVLNGEIILADSGSTDSTLAIAANYPITVVQLADTSQRRCGIGPQLGYQFATGDYIYILDGDMELESGFLEAAIQALENDVCLGGVAGLVEEISDRNFQFRGRKGRNEEGNSGECLWLGMGGLYRRDALKSVGYMSNRNLFAHEEQELGLRLAVKGWKMRRLPHKSVTHYGHTETTIPLIKKRWVSGYLYGAGQMLRLSMGTRYFESVIKVQKHLVLTLGLWILLISGILIFPISRSVLLLWVAVIMLLVMNRLARYKSIKDALLCIIVWHVNSLAMLIGIFLPIIDPYMRIDANIILDNRSLKS